MDLRKLRLNPIFWLVLITILAGLLRFYKLGEYPVQLNHDEISQLYDLASIAQTQKDIYGNYLPLAFPSTGEYKVGHYIYLSLIPYWIFGMQEYTIRIAAAFFGTLTVLLTEILIKRLTNSWKIALIAALFVAISPADIFYSRKSFEGVIGGTLVIGGLILVSKFLTESKKSLTIGLFGVALLIAAMYVYTSFVIIVPLILLIILWTLRKRLKADRRLIWGFMTVTLLLLLPLVLISIADPTVGIRARAVFINQDLMLGKLLSHINTGSKLIDSLAQLYLSLQYVVNRYIEQFNLSYLFLNGLNLTNQGPVGVGPLMVLQLPLVCLGVYSILIIKKFQLAKLLLIIIAIAFIPSAVTFEPFSPHRSTLAFTLISSLTGFGVMFLWKSLKKNWQKVSFMVLLSSVVTLNLIYFLNIYLISYPYEKSQHLHYPFKEVAVYASSQKSRYDTIIFDQYYGQHAPVMGVAGQYYIAYYGGYQPSVFQQKLKIDRVTGSMGIDNIILRKVEWREDKMLKNSLLIVSPWRLDPDKTPTNQIIRTFYFFDHSVAFYAIKT